MANSDNTKEQTRKFFIYARKSIDSEDRQVRSISDQISELQELAKKENLEIVDTIVENQKCINIIVIIMNNCGLIFERENVSARC